MRSVKSGARATRPDVAATLPITRVPFLMRLAVRTEGIKIECKIDEEKVGIVSGECKRYAMKVHECLEQNDMEVVQFISGSFQDTTEESVMFRIDSAL